MSGRRDRRRRNGRRRDRRRRDARRRGGRRHDRHRQDRRRHSRRGHDRPRHDRRRRHGQVRDGRHPGDDRRLRAQRVGLGDEERRTYGHSHGEQPAHMPSTRERRGRLRPGPGGYTNRAWIGTTARRRPTRVKGKRPGSPKSRPAGSSSGTGTGNRRSTCARTAMRQGRRSERRRPRSAGVARPRRIRRRCGSRSRSSCPAWRRTAGSRSGEATTGTRQNSPERLSSRLAAPPRPPKRRRKPFPSTSRTTIGRCRRPAPCQRRLRRPRRRSPNAGVSIAGALPRRQGSPRRSDSSDGSPRTPRPFARPRARRSRRRARFPPAAHRRADTEARSARRGLVSMCGGRAVVH